MGSVELDDDSYHVYFSMDENAHVDVNDSYILIIPESGTWNDFGYKPVCKYVVRDVNENIYYGLMYLGFMGNEQSPLKVIKKLVPEGYKNAKELPGFFSLCGAMKDYRSLVSDVGVERSKDILLSLKDLVALRYFEHTPNWVEEATKSEIFTLSFVRDSDRFFAFHNAHSILSGIEHEVLGSISTNMILNFKLECFKNEHLLEFDFSSKSIIPKRINVLIGKNGLGKSHALRQIATSLINNSDTLTDSEEGRPMLSRLLAIGTPGETENTFPREKNKSHINYRRLMLRRNSRHKDSRGFGELLVQLVRSNEKIGKNSRWRIFVDALNGCLPLDGIMIPLEHGIQAMSSHVVSENEGDFYVPLGNLNSGGEQASLEIWGAIRPKADPVRWIDGKVFSLSSGQLAFLQFAVQACLFVENGTLVLLDEPETHLHPNLITNFIELLDNLLEMTGSISILATHSAYFVREVAGEQVLVFQEREPGVISIERPMLKTFGANVGALSHFVFDDELANRLSKKVESALISTAKTKDEIIEELKDDLSIEALMLLKSKYLDS